MIPEHGTTPGEIPPEEKTGEVDSEETAETKDPLKDVEPSGAATEASASSAKEEEKKGTSDQAFAELLENYFDSKGNLTTELQGLEEAVAKTALGENAETEEGVEIAKELIALIKEIIKIISPDLKTELENHPETRAKIVSAFCEPVIQGHLNAVDITSLVKKIDILPIGDIGVSDHGHDGVMHYTPGSRTVTIGEEILSGTYKGIKLDFRHIINHEISHGLNDVVLADETIDALFNQMITEKPKFSSEAHRVTREVLDAAESGEVPGFLSHHSRNSLEGLKNLDNEFLSLSKAQKEVYKDLDNFKQTRKIRAAIEIVTDYTAIYMLSDGSENSFYSSCVDASESSAFDNFIAGSFQIPEGENRKAVAKNELSKLNKSVANGKETGQSLNENHPKLVKMREVYSAFYKQIQATLKGKKGTIGSLLDGEGDDPDSFSTAGHRDGAVGFQEGQGSAITSNEAKGWLAAGGELLKSFSDEVNITDPLTK